MKTAGGANRQSVNFLKGFFFVRSRNASVQGVDTFSPFVIKLEFTFVRHNTRQISRKNGSCIIAASTLLAR